MSRSKKINKKIKTYNYILICLLVVISLILLMFLMESVFFRPYYLTESREKNINKSKKSDAKDYETIGWVRVQGTNIDYPVYGAIKNTFQYPVNDKSFTWTLNEDTDFHNVMMVYGHNIMNLGPKPKMHDETFTKMEELMDFVYYDFAKDNKYIQLSINGNDYLYKVFSVAFIDVGYYNEYPEGEFSQEAKDLYIKDMKEKSIYDYNVKVPDDSKILSVVTCTRFFDDDINYDFIVTGKLVNKGERANNYKVTKNDNYKKIEKILKGSDEDEESDA